MKSSCHGFLVVDKPPGLTSRAAVDRAQGWFPRGTRLGHTGTLDPLATGVLVLAVGNGARLTEYVQHMAKTYRAGLQLGARSDTDDADGAITPVQVDQLPDAAAVRRCLDAMVGEIDQVPPAYSAAKLSGRRAYDLARKGEDISLAPRRVRVHGIDILAYDYPHLEIVVRCGKGTYIRSLARDLGERLGCGALVASLRRTRVGPFTETEAVPLEADRTQALARLQPLAAGVAELPSVRVGPAEVARLRRGQAISPEGGGFTPAAEVAVLDRDGNLVAVALVAADGRNLQPVKVMAD